MTPVAFIAKRRASELQEHFVDLCRLFDEPTPAEADPTGEQYCFERGARKDIGGDGWAAVWKRGCFALETCCPPSSYHCRAVASMARRISKARLAAPGLSPHATSTHAEIRAWSMVSRRMRPNAGSGTAAPS